MDIKTNTINSPRIILIDDDVAINYLHRIVIKEVENAAEILSYLNAAEAIEDIQLYLSNTEALPNIIFLDINMPEMNGWEFLNEYAKLSICGHQKPLIIMLSTSILPQDIAMAREHPLITEFIQKPLTGKTMCQLMNKYFQI